MVVLSDADLPYGRAQMDTDLPCRFRMKMAKTRRQTLMLKDRERHHRDCSNYEKWHAVGLHYAAVAHNFGIVGFLRLPSHLGHFVSDCNGSAFDCRPLHH